MTMRMMINIIVALVILGGLIFFMISCKNKSIDNSSTKTTLPSVGAAPIKFVELLFAEHTIKEVNEANNPQPINPNSVWGKFQQAEKLIEDNKKAEAINILKEIASDKDSESRTILWAWNGLRELGENPANPIVLGLILEVPQQGTIEYLAVFADGRARYINYTGRVGVWESRTEEMDKLIGDILIKSQNYVNKIKLAKGRNKAPSDKVRFSFLTTLGIFQTQKAFNELTSQQNDIYDIYCSATLILSEMLNKMIK